MQEVDAVKSKRIAVVGAGVAGLVAAHHLRLQGFEVTLLEAGAEFGGHAHTVDVHLDGWSHGVDTGFLVFNERTYPGLIALLAQLGVVTAPTEMSFSVQSARANGAPPLEWSGTSLASVFTQKRNLFSPRFLGMLFDILRFNRLATRLALADNPGAAEQTVQSFLTQHRMGKGFVEDYFLPMVACIWSCPTEQMLAFPMATLVRFCHNHGLLQITGRPQWHTVVGGSREYVKKIVAQQTDARRSTPVVRVDRLASAVVVHTPLGQETFDQVVFACHPHQILTALGPAASADEQRVLGAIRYQPNTAVLHTDSGVLPKHPKAWAAWNYERAALGGAEPAVCLHYLINRLQPLPFTTPVIVSLNPITPPDPDKVLQQLDYEHPVFDHAAIAAQGELPRLQGQQRTWFCGAWCGYGFHEDGLQSGLSVARQLTQSAKRQQFSYA